MKFRQPTGLVGSVFTWGSTVGGLLAFVLFFFPTIRTAMEESGLLGWVVAAVLVVALPWPGQWLAHRAIDPVRARRDEALVHQRFEAVLVNGKTRLFLEGLSDDRRFSSTEYTNLAVLMETSKPSPEVIYDTKLCRAADLVRARLGDYLSAVASAMDHPSELTGNRLDARIPRPGTPGGPQTWDEHDQTYRHLATLRGQLLRAMNALDARLYDVATVGAAGQSAASMPPTH